jgi:hypothetical protein
VDVKGSMNGVKRLIQAQKRKAGVVLLADLQIARGLNGT